jgi:hypothetical protein
VLVVVAACGTHGGVEGHAGCAVVDAVAFVATQVGQQASSFVRFVNQNADPTAALAVTIDGPDSADFDRA